MTTNNLHVTMAVEIDKYLFVGTSFKCIHKSATIGYLYRGLFQQKSDKKKLLFKVTVLIIHIIIAAWTVGGDK